MSKSDTPNLSPTFAEMAARHRAKARNLRFTADQVGENTPKGRRCLADATLYEGIAAGLAEKQAEQLAARDGFLTEFRKARANRPATVTHEEIASV